METNNTTTPATTTTAVIVWNAATEAQVAAIIATGASVPKGLMKLAPKGFVAGLRATRKDALVKDTSKLLGGFTDRGFKIVALTPIKELKNGVQQVTLKLATPKPTAKMTLEEFAAQAGVKVDDIIAGIEMK